MRVADEAPGVDSRQYGFAYLLRDISDWPADFLPLSCGQGWDLGLFLPAPSPGTSGTAESSPWILLLLGDRFLCVPHPFAQIPQTEMALSALVELETGDLLLDCWFALRSLEMERRWRFFARDQERVVTFLRRLKERMTLRTRALRVGEVGRWGGPLEPKFSLALSEELLNGEASLLTFRNLPIVRRKAGALIASHERTAGDLVSVSSRQLVWITERWQGSVRDYGTIRRSAPLRVWRDVALHRRDGTMELEFSLAGGSFWRVPIEPENVPAASAFAQEAGRLLKVLRGSGPVA